MSVTEIEHPNYYEGQYIGAQDLIAAQEYQRQHHQRHRLAAHTWGIAAGLDLEERTKPGGGNGVDAYVKPGYAVDGFGRAIVVLTPYKIPEALFAQFQLEAGTTKRLIPVWLRYRELKTDPPKPGFAICSDEEQMYRVRETFMLVAGEMPPSQLLDKISVGGISVDAFATELDGSIPYQALPGPGDKSRWLILLGLVSWSGTGFVKSDDPTTLRFLRPYIGAIAESILAPAGKLRIRDRHKPTDLSKETPDFAGIEGSLRVDGAANFRDFLNVDSKNRNDGKLYFDPLSPELTSPGLTFGFFSFEGIGSKRTAGGNQYGLDFYTAAVARLSISKDGDVGIGTAPNPLFRLNVAGWGFANGWALPSDHRLKGDIRPLEGVLDKIRKIRGVCFEWTEEYAALSGSTGKSEIGVLGQEIEAVFPELVTRWGDKNYLAVDYGRLSAVLIEAVKELAAENQTFRARVDALEKQARKPRKEPRK